jgi:hypothetical protein
LHTEYLLIAQRVKVTSQKKNVVKYEPPNKQQLSVTVTFRLSRLCLGSFANSRGGPRIEIKSKISRNFGEGFSDVQPGEVEELLREPREELIKELVKSASEEAWEGNCKHSDGQSSLLQICLRISENWWADHITRTLQWIGA